ncbi:MAG TPA: bifunctional diaminohydroxyphosphoribosylaminopyrimidine deaminase/5-amino-6-(5-phosphoribosylamino)uracil reductase RibD [Methylocystis sp.]|nr:bifunctional diaminohydroxyphosphoribosylaminopyrimidine deaminase/5-amino-6-(5-phosphoribosylamino)uracil reductase RibD [Methylocystis sp.]
MTNDPRDEAFMAAALALGRRNLGRAAPNPAVGALLVKNGVVIARGFTGAGGRPHGEAMALAAAGARARGATLYATLEPCSHHGETPPCAEAIIAAGVARVVSAMEDPDPRVAGRGHALLREAGISVTSPVLERDARRAHLGHIRRLTERRPMVTLKLAQTPDGFAAGATHDPRLHVTGPLADAFSHMQRALHDAIMVGAATAREDDPLMTVRLPGLEDEKRLRVVLDSKLSLSPRSRFAALARKAPTLVIVARDVSDSAVAAFTEATGAEAARVETDMLGRVALPAALAELARRGVTRVFCEGGPRLAESLICGGFADEVILHTGEKPFGGAGRLALRQAARAAVMDERLYERVETTRLGPDTMVRHEKRA